MTSVAPSHSAAGRVPIPKLGLLDRHARAAVTWVEALGSSRARLALGLETLVEIGVDRLHQRVDLAFEEMLGARGHLLLDYDALLGLELCVEPGDVLGRNH